MSPGTILATLLAVWLAIILIAMPRTGSHAIWIAAKLPPISRAAALIVARWAKSWVPGEACAKHCREGDASRALLSLVQKLGCPEQAAAEAMLSRGLLPPVAASLKAGCKPPEGLEEEWETLGHLLGASQAYREGSSIYVCMGPERAVLLGDKVYSTRQLPEPVRQRLAKLAPPQPGEGALLLTYGCRGPGIRLERLARLLLPESPSKMPWLAVHLGIEPPSLGDLEGVARAVRSIARRLAWLARSLGEKAPWEAVAVRLVLGEEPLECPAEESLLTDKPVLACPYYSPYEALPGEAGGSVGVMLASLAARGGNPVRAAVMRMLEGDEHVARELIRSARPRRHGSPQRNVQVEPWYAPCYGRPLKRARCFRPPIDCWSWTGPGPVEEWARQLGLEPPDLECPKSGRGEGRTGPAGGEPLYYEPLGDPFAAALQAAKEAGEGRTLVVAPDEASGKVLATLTGLPLVWGCPWCERAIAWWDRLELEPWLAEGFDTILLLYPERFPKPRWLVNALQRSPKDYLEQAKEWLLQVSTAPRTASLSRALASVSRAVPRGRVGDESGGRPRLPLGPSMEGLEALFRRLWGGRFSLREHQRTALSLLLEAWSPSPGRPVLGVFPTGYGKSAIFQLAGLLLGRLSGGYTLVVSPLRALLRDQVDGLLRRGVTAGRIDSGVPSRARRALLEAALLGLLDFLYVTPERFQDPVFYEAFASRPPVLAVLDEAHTVVKWGGSFRPSYYYAMTAIRDLRGETGTPYVSLFTATAPGRVAREVLALLGAERVAEARLPGGLPGGEWDALVLRVPTVRENLEFAVVPVQGGEARLSELEEVLRDLSGWARSVSEPWLGVVFTGYVRSERHPWANAEGLAQWVEERLGIPAVAYHGQLPERERRRREDAIYEASRSGQGPRIVVATKAFGMGVDLPNIRWIVHVTPSDSVEDYYQEAGRAGRDGLPAVAVHLYNEDDFRDKRRSILAQRPRPSTVLRLYNTLARIHGAIREDTGGWPLIAVPLDVLPSPVRAMKAIDYLRSAGLLDYWVVQQPIAAYRIPSPSKTGGIIPGEEILPWSMGLGGGVFVGPRLREPPPGWKRVMLRFETCQEGGRHIPLRITAGGRSVSAGRCSEWKSVALPERPRVLVVMLSMDTRHDELAVLPPAIFAHVSRLGAWELGALEEYRSIIDSASRIALREGWRSREVDRYIKEMLEKSLSAEPPETPEHPPSSLLEAVRTCPTAAECAREAAETLLEAERWLGTPHAITLALQDESLYSLVERHYRELAGRPVRARWRGAYKSMLRASREGPHRLMDLGYLVVVARALPRTVEALQRLEGYPYHTRLFYHR